MGVLILPKYLLCNFMSRSFLSHTAIIFSFSFAYFFNYIPNMLRYLIELFALNILTVFFLFSPIDYSVDNFHYQHLTILYKECYANDLIGMFVRSNKNSTF